MFISEESQLIFKTPPDKLNPGGAELFSEVLTVPCWVLTWPAKFQFTCSIFSPLSLLMYLSSALEMRLNVFSPSSVYTYVYHLTSYDILWPSPSGDGHSTTRVKFIPLPNRESEQEEICFTLSELFFSWQSQSTKSKPSNIQKVGCHI